MDWSTAVLCCFMQLQDQSEPVTVQIGLQPVPDWSCTCYSKIIIFFGKYLLNKCPVHCTYCWYSMVWLHSWLWWVRWLSMGRIWNHGLTCEMMGSRSKWQAHVRTMSSHWKQWAHVQSNGLTFETTWWARIEMTVSCLRQWGHQEKHFCSRAL